MALTLRHAVSRSGTNTLEGYFHPRQLAFSLGALALVAFLSRRRLRRGRAAVRRRGFSTRPPHSGSRSGSPSRRWSRTDRAGCRSASSRPQVEPLGRGRSLPVRSPAGCRSWIPTGWRRFRPRTISSRSRGLRCLARQPRLRATHRLAVQAAARSRRGRPGRARPRVWLPVAPDHLCARPALQPRQGCARGAASDAADLLDARFPGHDLRGVGASPKAWRRCRAAPG